MAVRPNADLPPRMLRTQEAARFLGISIRTLEKHRTYGTGPTYRKSVGASSIPSTTSKPGPRSARASPPATRPAEGSFPPVR